jgi:hypothetical protein
VYESENRWVAYPAEFTAIEPRELARLSQTDVTSDPQLGLQYAAAAYDAGLRPEIAAADPTLAGEAAAKAGFRAAQADLSLAQTGHWFMRSYEQLDDSASPDIAKRRERIATLALEGRSWGLRLLRHAISEPQLAGGGSAAFASGEDLLQEQHQRGKRWDPYGTMLARHRATFEAEFGSAPLAAKVASQGLWRALRARQETANSPAGPLKHAKFVGKQLLMNTAALSLAVSRPLNVLPKGKGLRRQLALKLLG